MKASLLVLAVAGAALIAATQASAQQACTPSGNSQSRTFCGPAKARLKVHGRTYDFKNGGNCSSDSSSWSLNIGTITFAGRPKHRYFGITVFSKKAGTHDAAVTWQLPGGKTNSLRNAKVTLARGRQKGTFRGSVKGGGTASGSFTCK